VSTGSGQAATEVRPGVAVMSRPEPIVPAAEAPGTHPRRATLVAFGVFVAVCGWVLWRTGPAPVGRLDFFEHSAATWPHTVLAPESQYVLRVPWGQLAYQLLPAHSITSYLTLQLGCLALVCCWVRGCADGWGCAPD